MKVETSSCYQNLLHERTFQTRVNDFLSAIRDLFSGVIQGSVLGPLLFLIYIYIYIIDLAELLASFNIKIKLFADDVKLYVKVVGPADESELQIALSALVSWADSSVSYTHLTLPTNREV